LVGGEQHTMCKGDGGRELLKNNLPKNHKWSLHRFFRTERGQNVSWNPVGSLKGEKVGKRIGRGVADHDPQLNVKKRTTQQN